MFVYISFFRCRNLYIYITIILNKRYYSTWTHPVSKCVYQIDHIFTLRENLRHFSDAGSVSGQFVDSDHRAVKATLRSLVAPKKKKVLKDDRHKLMRLDYAILQSEEGRDELARRALEILNKSKSDDKTSYEAIADALHLATEQVLPNVLEQNRYGSLKVSWLFEV